MRKRTRRKVYGLINPITMAIEGAAISQEHRLNQLRVRELAAIDNFSRGKATEGDWHDVKALTSLCEHMAKSGIGPEALEDCERATSALKEDWSRYEKTGMMGTTGPGLQAYRSVFEYHDLQRQSVARSEYEKHIQATINRIRFVK